MNDHKALTLVMLIERLERLIVTSPAVPLGGRVMVRLDEATELLQRIREAIPEELTEAARVLEQRERLLQEGQAQAERMVLEAEEYAGRLVRDSEVLRQAQQQAERIVEEGRRRAAELEAGANEYADSVLMMVEQALQKSLAEIQRHLAQVQRGREELARRLGEMAASPEEAAAAGSADAAPS